jgi:hypothetical protein
MWINFDVLDRVQKFAVRPFLGCVNGISGESRARNMAAASTTAHKWDYIVLLE